MTHDRNMSKRVKEAKEQLDGRDLLEQRNLKHLVLDMTHDRNISKRVKEAKEQLDGRDLLEQRNLKHLVFQS